MLMVHLYCCHSHQRCRTAAHTDEQERHRTQVLQQHSSRARRSNRRTVLSDSWNKLNIAYQDRVSDKLCRTSLCVQALHAASAVLSNPKRVPWKICIIHLLRLIVDLGKQQPQNPLSVLPSQLLQLRRHHCTTAQQVSRMLHEQDAVVRPESNVEQH